MKRWYWMIALLAAAGCSDGPSEPDNGVNEGDLHFLKFEAANAITVRQASFWAVKGQTRELEMKYADGTDFLEFEVRSQSLLRRPDGRIFLNGDSVLISVTLDPNNRVIVDFQPSGLLFNPLDPARLEINYKGADDDIDDDGDEDARDIALELSLRIWQQERTGRPWLPLATLRIDEDDLEARVLSFTGFAMATN